MKPVPIAYFIDEMRVGGTERQLATLIKGLDRDRFQPHLFMIRGADEWNDLGCEKKLFRIPAKVAGPRGAVQIMRMARALRKRRVMIVQTFFVDAAFVGVVAARLARVPVAITSRRDLGFWYTPSLTKRLRRLHKWSGRVIANSESVRRNVVEKEGIPGEDIEVIPNGMLVGKLAEPGDRASIRSELGIDGDGPVVGIVANLNREVKRVDLFVEAVPAVAAACPSVRFVVIGKGHLRESLEQRCRELRVADKVVFTGGRDDVYSLLHAFDIGVNCSDSEGFSNAVIEYMLAGVAAVASDVGGNAELVEHGKTGLLFPPGDPHGLAESIIRLIGEPGLSKSMRDTARDIARSEFSADAMVNAHMEFYDKLLDAARVNG